MATDLLGALRCGTALWLEVLGAPLVTALIFMTAYALSTALLFRTARICHRNGERGLWWTCGFLSLFLLINIPLDLHHLVRSSGNCLATAQGWHEQQRAFHDVLTLTLVAFSAFLILAAVLMSHRHPVSTLMLLAGVFIAAGASVGAIEDIGSRDSGEYFSKYRMLMEREESFLQLVGVGLMIGAALLRQATRHRRSRVPVQTHSPQHADYRPKLRKRSRKRHHH